MFKNALMMAMLAALVAGAVVCGSQKPARSLAMAQPSRPKRQ